MAIRFINKAYGANSSTAIANDTTGRAVVQNLPEAAGFVYDSVDNQVKFNGNGTVNVQVDTTTAQTLTNKTLTAPVITGAAVTQAFNTYSADGAVTVSSQVAYLTKGSAGAYTLAAPGAAGIGVEITLTTGSDFAHVVTFTGSTLRDGTTGAKVTWTAAAFAGSSITVVGVTAVLWNVVSKNLGTVA